MTEVRVSDSYGAQGLSLQDYENRYSFIPATDFPSPEPAPATEETRSVLPPAEHTVSASDTEAFLLELLAAIDVVSTALIRQRSLLVHGTKDTVGPGVGPGLFTERATIKHVANRKSSAGRGLFSDSPVFLSLSPSGQSYVRLVTGRVEQRWSLSARRDEMLAQVDQDITTIYSMRTRAETALRSVRASTPNLALDLLVSEVVGGLNASQEKLGFQGVTSTFRPVAKNPFSTTWHCPTEVSVSEEA